MAKIPDIRALGSWAAGAMRDWLADVRLWAQSREPNVTSVGSPLDKFTTRGELLDLGVLVRRSDGSFAPGVSGVEGPQGPPGPAGPPGDDGAGVVPPDLTPPPTPSGLTVTAGITTIIVQWDAPSYTQGRGNAFTNVYGAVWTDPDPAPVFNDVRTKKINVAVEAQTILSHPTNPNTRWCIWIKFQSRDGVESVVPAGGTNGVIVTTGQDVSALLDILSGAISESELTAALSTRIDKIENHGSNLLQNSSFEIDVDGSGVADSWLNYSIGTVSGVTRSIVTDRFVHASKSQRVAWTSSGGTTNDRAGVRQDFGLPPDAVAKTFTASVYVAGTVGARAALRIEFRDAVSTLSGTTVTRTLTSSFARLNVSRVCDAGATICRVYVWLDSAAGAAEIVIDAAQLQEGGLTGFIGPDMTAAIEQEIGTRTSQVGGIEAKYTVKVDLNGYMTGFGLIATANDATPTSEFQVRADRISFGPPTNFSQESTPTATAVGQIWFKPSTRVFKSWNGSTWVNFTAPIPFIVQTTQTTEGGATIPPGVYMDAAYIKNLTAAYAQIQNLVADSITASDISAAQITGGTMKVGAWIQSTNYTSGSNGAGWRINANGTADLQAAYIRGQLVADQINGNGLVIRDTDGTPILGSGYPVTAGWLNVSIGSDNLLSNSGFEVGSPIATGWISNSSSSTGLTHTKVAETGTLGGTFSQRVTATMSDRSSVVLGYGQLDIPAVALRGKTVTAAADCYVNVSGATRRCDVLIQSWDGVATTLVAQNFGSLLSSSRQRFSATGVVPADADTLRVYFRARALSGTTGGVNLTCNNGTANGTTVTLNFPAQASPPFTVGSIIDVNGVTPSGINGLQTVTACTTTSVTFSDTTPGPITAFGTVHSTRTVAFTVDDAKLEVGDVATAYSVSPNDKVGIDNQITSVNISTYIAAAAIGWAQIGSLVIDTNGFIRSGQTAYNTGTGFYIGRDGGVPRFSVGSGSGQRITWDGTELNVRGEFSVGTAVRSGLTMGSGAGAVFEPTANGAFALGNTSRSLVFNGSTLQLNGDLIVTGNIQNDAIIEVYSAEGTGSSISVNVSVPAGETYKVIGIGFQTSQKNAAGSATLSLLGKSITLQAITIDDYVSEVPARTTFREGGTIVAEATRGVGTHSISLSGTAGVFKSLVVILDKR